MAESENYVIDRDIVIEDDNFKTISEKYIKKAEEIEELITEFATILKEITDTAIVSGNFHDKILIFTEEVENMKDKTLAIANKISEKANNFIEDFDTADSYLYYSK